MRLLSKLVAQKLRYGLINVFFLRNQIIGRARIVDLLLRTQIINRGAVAFDILRRQMREVVELLADSGHTPRDGRVGPGANLGGPESFTMSRG